LRVAGDDPNYWMALTQQADADVLSRKVRKLLKDQQAQDSCPPKKVRLARLCLQQETHMVPDVKM
jgi:hypothetical protein